MSTAPSSDKSETPPNHPRSSTSSYFTYPVTYAVSSVLRRLSTDPEPSKQSSGFSSGPKDMNSVFSPLRRHASPFQPPPLTPLTLRGYKSSTGESAKLLSKSLAEEIRLLMPPRLQLQETWTLAYSLEQDGVSLATLYKNCDQYRGKRGGYVLVIRDGEGGAFGAYLSDPPRLSPHYFGNGECFLWRAHTLPSIPTLANLPPPPSADTTNAQRMTTLARLNPPTTSNSSRSGTSTPERIRFKAFPYSGINDYMIFCEQDYLSVGGGDGHYGLWLNDNLEQGISDSCPTFGNERLSDEGSKFDVLGVELWFIG